MEFDLSKIKFSKNDFKKCIKIPETLDSRLAEFVGIIVGDGHIGKHRSKNGNYSSAHYQIRICGNIKDKEYYATYVNNLFSKIFNAQFSFFNSVRDNTIVLRKESKAIYYFMTEIMNIPSRKDNVRIPRIICDATDEIKSSFLRGLADTDFTLTIKNKEGKPYPVIQGVSKSNGLINDVSRILYELDIKNCIAFDKGYSRKRKKSYPGYRIYINGTNRIKTFISKIGFSNPRHLNTFHNYLEGRVRRDSNPRPTA